MARTPVNDESRLDQEMKIRLRGRGGEKWAAHFMVYR